MKTLCVVSDSHGNRAAINRLFPVFAESDYIIHLGDTSSDGQYIKNAFGGKTKVVNGNCDFMRVGENELVLAVEDVKIFACHGDRYGVKQGYERIARRAEELGCGVALFGHTHCPEEYETDKVRLFNPGTLSRYSRNTYLYLAVNGGKAVGKIVEI